MSEEKCEFNMQGWCCCGLTTVPKEIGYADILCSDECNKNCYYKQLQTAKEELQAEKEEHNECKFDRNIAQLQVHTLTQQNKQMRELISEINLEYSDDGILSKATKYAIQQALKGGE